LYINISGKRNMRDARSANKNEVLREYAKKSLLECAEHVPM